MEKYKKGVSLLGLQPVEAMMVAAHEGDLTAAQAAGLQTAYIKVPEKDIIDDVFEQPDKTGFDVEASDFEDLCKKLKV